jgi:hypothetical protein
MNKNKVLFSMIIATILIPFNQEAYCQCSGGFTNNGQVINNLYSFGISSGDLNSDGNIDVFIANSGQPNTIWFNDGDGVFSDSGQRLGGSYNSTDVSLGDLDGDGDLDAFIIDYYANPKTVWFNNGSGFFSDSGQRLGNLFSFRVSLGDVDGDGDLDAFIANIKDQPNTVWINNGNGLFNDSGQRLGNSSSYKVALGDLDGDGDLDAFVANWEGQQLQEQFDTVWFNNGNGIFTDSGQRLDNLDSESVSLGDLDGDGDLDAFVANNANNNGPDKYNTVWFNDGYGFFTDSGQTLGNADSYDVALGDFDSDGDLDAFVSNYLDQPNTVWLNDGYGFFTDNGQLLGNAFSASVSLNDFDNDGDLDAFVSNWDQPDTVLINEFVCDEDNDGIADELDNCPSVPNSDQINSDDDEQGDVCDTDDDNDEIDDSDDNCPLDSNSSQADADNDGIGDACDTDDDNDGILDGEDLCFDTVNGEVVNANGCSINNLCPCTHDNSSWKNHGAYVSCVARTSGDFLILGLISESEKDIIVSNAAESNCGKK